MNGLKIRALQILSHIFPAKSLQETHVFLNTFKNRLWNLFNSSYKENDIYETRKINSSTISNDLESIFIMRMTLPEITMRIALSTRLLMYILHSESNMEIKRLETLKSFIKYDDLSLLLDENPAFKNKYYNAFLNIRFSTLISDTILNMKIRKTRQKFYANCSKDEKKSLPSCEETKKKCVKGPLHCLKKSTNVKTQTCQSILKDNYKKSREPTQKSCSEEYCTIEKEALAMKDKESKEESMKKQIDREYKEIEECKKSLKIKEKKDEKLKKDSSKDNTSCLNHMTSLCTEKQKKDGQEVHGKKFRSTLNETIFLNSMDTMHTYKSQSIQLKIINDRIPIIARDIRLFNVIFDRSFSTIKVNYQDDFTIEQTTSHKMIEKCSANNSDFIYGDELPNFVEIENDDEEEEEYDWATGRPVPGIN